MLLYSSFRRILSCARHPAAAAFSLPLRERKWYKAGMSAKLTIGFLGAGKMATALAKGFIRAGLVTAKQVMASDPSEPPAPPFAREIGAKTTASNPAVAEVRRGIWCWPSNRTRSAGCWPTSATTSPRKHLLISIAAGVPLAKLEAGLGAGRGSSA